MNLNKYWTNKEEVYKMGSFVANFWLTIAIIFVFCI
jgi:hypothetical protein